MFYEVTRKLPLTAINTSPPVEFSVGVALEGNNAASFQLQMISAAAAFSTVVAQLQGSNDLCNWEDIGSATLTATTAPSFQVYGGTNVIPWAFVRLRYTATTLSGSVQVMLKAAIELFQKG